MPEDPRRLLSDVLLRKPSVPTCADLDAWMPVWRAAQAGFGGVGPFVAAIAAALAADRLAWVFLSGYQGALQAAFPGNPGGAHARLASFCANESGRRITDIETTLLRTPEGLRLTGRKAWMVAAAGDGLLYVLARVADGPAAGPGSLCVVRVRGDAPGVRPGAPRGQGIIPEVPHCEVAFEAVSVQDDAVVPGDGYATYARPFRLCEGLFITGCALAHLLAQGHLHGFPEPWRQRCLAAIVALGECVGLPLDAPSTELVSSGALAFAGDLVGEAGPWLARHDPQAFARWQRDQGVLALGRDTLQYRARVAWAQLGWADPPSSTPGDGPDGREPPSGPDAGRPPGPGGRTLP